MGLLDKVKAGAEQAAAKAREGAEDLKAKRDLGQTYRDLGEKAFELIDRNELAHADLEPFAAKIRELRAELANEEAMAPPS
jgi:hypothetical protein